MVALVLGFKFCRCVLLSLHSIQCIETVGVTHRTIVSFSCPKDSLWGTEPNLLWSLQKNRLVKHTIWKHCCIYLHVVEVFRRDDAADVSAGCRQWTLVHKSTITTASFSWAIYVIIYKHLSHEFKTKVSISSTECFVYISFDVQKLNLRFLSVLLGALCIFLLMYKLKLHHSKG